MNARSNSNARFTIHRLQVAQELHQFIEQQVLPGTGIESAHFWAGFDAIVADLAPKNRALLAERDRLQSELDAWHRAHPGPIADMPAYRAFLEQIAYLVPQPAAQVTTANVDAELAQQAGPQLVVPITNARYALNAANARWGSLYDALYGTDAIPETDGAQKGKGYNPVRGAKVIAFARDFLDQSAPLAAGSHHDSTGYAVVDGALQVTLKDGSVSGLKNPAQLAGYQGDAAAPQSLLFAHNGIHFDLIIDRSTAIGPSDAAGVSDLVMEAALSTILDLEDSVAAVDAEDKVLGYSNWLGILKGTLTETFEKGGQQLTRGLNPDRLYTAADGHEHGPESARRVLAPEQVAGLAAVGRRLAQTMTAVTRSIEIAFAPTVKNLAVLFGRLAPIAEQMVVEQRARLRNEAATARAETSAAKAGTE